MRRPVQRNRPLSGARDVRQQRKVFSAETKMYEKNVRNKESDKDVDAMRNS